MNELIQDSQFQDNQIQERLKADPRSVQFCTPSRTGEVCGDYKLAYDHTFKLLIQNGISFEYNIITGDAFVDKARNRLLTTFLEHSNANNMFFLDDDIGWPGEKVIEFLQRPEDVISGLYPVKNDTGKFFPAEFIMKDGRIIERNGLWLAHWAPTGFMKISRRAAELITRDADVYPEMTDHFGNGILCYSVFEAGAMMPSEGHAPQFWIDRMGRKHRAINWRGEDVYFSYLYRDLGGEIWVDPDITFTHMGRKQWVGNFAQDCADKIAKTPPKPLSVVDQYFSEAAE
jgi:hypothetical protein